MKRRIAIKTIVGAMLAGSVAFGTPVLAQQPYYQGKTIRVIIPFSPGGGTDTFGRLISQHLGKHVAGNPTVVAENVPGAGGALGSNEFAERVAKDGTTLMVASGHMNLRVFLGLEGFKLNLNDLTPVVAAPMGHITAINPRTAGITDAKQIGQMKGRITKGLTDPVGIVESVLALDLLGVNYRPVPGFPGRGDTRLAFERGELMINSQSTPAFNARVKPLIAEGRAMTAYAIGFIDAQGRPVRDPGAPDIITAPELYQQIHGRMPSGQVWDAYKVVANLVQNTRGTVWVHSAAPQAAHAALRDGVDKMAKDPEFLAAVSTTLEGYDLITGPGLDQIKADLNGAPPEVLTWLRQMLSDKFGVKFENR